MSKDEFPEGPTEAAIAKRAYELYLQRGSVPGYELDDWLAAKAELTAAIAAATSENEAPTESQPPSTRTAVDAGVPGPRNGRDRNANRRVVRQSHSQ